MPQLLNELIESHRQYPLIMSDTNDVTERSVMRKEAEAFSKKLSKRGVVSSQMFCFFLAYRVSRYILAEFPLS